MKKIIIISVLMMFITFIGQSQNINWRSLESQQNIVSLNLGYDYGANARLGCYRSVNAFKPMILGGDFTLIFGDNLSDDYKVRLGGQMEVLEFNGFSLSGKIMAIYRRYETQLVRIHGFGSEFSIIGGYYRPKWHIALEVGFDKSIITHLKHSDIMRDSNPDVQDGWYIPSGGNWFYGLQAGRSLGRGFDLTGKFGVTKAQGNDEDALLPLYMQLGLNKRF